MKYLYILLFLCVFCILFYFVLNKNYAVHAEYRPIQETPLNEELLKAVINKDKSLANKYLKEGADPNSVLVTAIIHEQKDIVEMLLEAGASPNLVADTRKCSILDIYRGRAHGPEGREIGKILKKAGAKNNYPFWQTWKCW